MQRHELIEAFIAHYGCPPTHLVRAPGRVNLIGEHTDYNGLPVFPMAIERAVYVACGLGPAEAGRVELASVGDRFAAGSFSLPAEGPIPAAERGDWSNYVRAAAQKLLETGPLPPAQLVVGGDIPVGAGLSSSSALVVGAGLALSALASRGLERLRFAEQMAEAERYVGTASGGMDQAASVLGRAGHALRIDFDPLRVRSVPLPLDHRFVVAHSLVVAEKSAGARDAYNTRVGECRLALEALRAALTAELSRPVAHFGQLLELLPGRSPSSYLQLLARQLPAGAISIEQLADSLDRSVAQLRALLPATVRDLRQVEPLSRARHVLGEAERVEAAEQALRHGELEAFGAQMNASHDSCRDQYAISCPELEALVSVARGGGAIGARLTGAGFGGCTVNLVASRDLDRLLDALDAGYYRARGLGRAEEHCHVFDARDGASVEGLE
jgi:N-acetylgalactosamine kinase